MNDENKKTELITSLPGTTVQDPTKYQAHSTLDPVESIHAEGNLVTKLVERENSGWVVLGAWMAYGPVILVFGSLIVDPIAGKEDRLIYSLFLILALFVLVPVSMMLFKITYKWFRPHT